MSNKEVPELSVGAILTSQFSVAAEQAGCLEWHGHLPDHQIVMTPTLFISFQSSNVWAVSWIMMIWERLANQGKFESKQTAITLMHINAKKVRLTSSLSQNGEDFTLGSKQTRNHTPLHILSWCNIAKYILDTGLVFFSKAGTHFLFGRYR